MCCITLTALDATMATTELTRNVNQTVGAPWLPQNTEPKSVRMNWVVVIDENGTPQLRMHWNAPAQDD
jgi:hypothetical protein